MQHSRSTFVPIAGCLATLAALIVAGFTLLGADETPSEPGDETSFATYSSSSDNSDDADSSSRDVDAPPIAADDSDLEPRSRSSRDLQPEADQTASDVEPVDSGEPEESPLEDQPDRETAPVDTEPASRPAGSGGYDGPQGTLVVITNFARADVEVNGYAYPAYSDDLQNRGMELPAYEPHMVVVEYDGNQRIYEVELAAGEQRMLMVELTGLDEDASGDREQRDQRRRRGRQSDDDDVDDDKGRLTVYARPRGTIYVDDQNKGERAPATIDIEPGRHQVQVEYEGGEMSETKNVRVREGSQVKLFFRQDE